MTGAKIAWWAWWAVLVTALSLYLVGRAYPILNGNATAFDVAALLILAALLLTPLFAEVTLWGMSFKKELEKAQTELKGQIADLKLSVATAVEVRKSFQPNIYFPVPPPDELLPQLKVEIEGAVRRALEDQPAPSAPDPSTEPPSSEIQELFRVRYAIDKQVRRIARGRDLEHRAPGFEGRRSTMALFSVLSRAELISPNIAAGLRDVYAICSRAIHGEDVTPAQVDFVREVARKLLSTLWKIS
jgi:hypothetical protein